MRKHLVASGFGLIALTTLIAFHPGTKKVAAQLQSTNVHHVVVTIQHNHAANVGLEYGHNQVTG